jgi:hypothetical protein
VLSFGIDDDEFPRSVLIDVGGALGEQKEEVYYKRAFDLQIAMQGGEPIVNDERDRRTEVRIDQLAATDAQGKEIEPKFSGPGLGRAAFAVGDGPPRIQVQFHVDAPGTAFRRSSDRVVLSDGEGRPREAHADRQVTASVIDIGEAGLVLQTRVEDFSWTWQPGVRNAQTPLQLSLELSGESEVSPHVVPVKLDAARPEITEFRASRPGGNVPSGRLAVEVIARDALSGLANDVQVARSVNPNAPFGAEDKLLEMSVLKSEFDEVTRHFYWQALLPADVAKPGDPIPLVVRVRDNVGHSSAPRREEFTVPLPVAPTVPLGTIWGRVTKRGTPVQEIVVELEGPAGKRTANLDSNDTYYFRQVPAGAYTVRSKVDVVLAVAGRMSIGDERAIDDFDPSREKDRRVDLNLEEIR